MFSTIVYSVLLAFALSDIGGGGLAVAAQGTENRGAGDCGKAIDDCGNKPATISDGTESMKACSAAKERAECLQKMKTDSVGGCDVQDIEKNAKKYGKDYFKVPACACCPDEVYKAVEDLTSSLYIDEKQTCQRPGNQDVCMQCKVDVAAVNTSFKDAKTCDKLTDALNKAKEAIVGPKKCTEDHLKSFLAAQKFVIENAADCHTEQCIQLGEELRVNYTNLALKVKNGSTEATECHPENNAAFRLGSAIAPLLGALGIVLITFKIL